MTMKTMTSGGFKQGLILAGFLCLVAVLLSIWEPVSEQLLGTSDCYLPSSGNQIVNEQGILRPPNSAWIWARLTEPQGKYITFTQTPKRCEYMKIPSAEVYGDYRWQQTCHEETVERRMLVVKSGGEFNLFFAGSESGGVYLTCH